MSRKTTPEDDSAEELGSRLLQCVEFGNFYTGETTSDGEYGPRNAR